MKNAILVAAVLGSTVLVACGDSDPAPTVAVAPAQVVAPLNATTGAATVGALVNESFVFDGGVPEFGTTGTTTVMFTSASASPTFSISSGGNTATGVMSFGSCIFRIVNSTFTPTPTHPLSSGKIITIDPCDIEVQTASMVADGTLHEKYTALRLNRLASRGVPIPVSVSPTGQLRVRNIIVPGVTVNVTTGTGAASPS